jgi:GNAT superfamily N-acetyltransferase
MQRSVTTTYLEMSSPDQWVKGSSEPPDTRIIRAEIPNPDFSHFLFVSVGLPWQWFSRLTWRRCDWEAYLASDAVETWVGYQRGTPFGYFELERQAGDDVEIKFFGIQTGFIGQGLGSYLLSQTIERAWAMGAKRVWLHTCTLDHPSALSNYLGRGFNVYGEETAQEDIPDKNDPVWYSTAFYDSTIRNFS